MSVAGTSCRYNNLRIDGLQNDDLFGQAFKELRVAYARVRDHREHALEQGFAQQYDRGLSTTSNPPQAAEFSVRQWGFHAGDQWRTRSNATLPYGERMDAPR